MAKPLQMQMRLQILLIVTLLALIGLTMSSQVSPTPISPFSFLKPSQSSSFFLSPCSGSANEIELIINGLSLNKATGPFSIPTAILKTLKHEISIP